MGPFDVAQVEIAGMKLDLAGRFPGALTARTAPLLGAAKRF